jgi:hypothetical protein
VELWGALEATDIARYLRRARWGYALLNAGHIFGIAMLVGALVPLDLRLMGLAWRRTPLPLVERLLRPTAAAGLGLAAATGFLLFASNAGEYAATRLFQLKMALVALGAAHALVHVRGFGHLSPARQRIGGFVSAVVWIAALICGRLLGFL